MIGGDELGSRLESVRERIRRAAERAGRDPALVRVVAVTKGQPASAIEAALAAGLTDIGESRVQEAQAKQAQVAGGAATWHMIGHLQGNKAGAAAAVFDVVQSLDSPRLAAALDRHRGGSGRLRVLVEVDLTGIPGRSGVAEDGCAALLTEVGLLPRLEAAGLMTIAPPGPPEAAAACFARLGALRDRLSAGHGVALAELSMGMSDDFEVAVDQGATMVRLGRVLFGERAPAGRGPGARLS